METYKGHVHQQSRYLDAIEDDNECSYCRVVRLCAHRASIPNRTPFVPATTKAQPASRAQLVSDMQKHDIHYHEPGFIEGNIEMWKALRDAAYEARKTEKADGVFIKVNYGQG